MDFGLPNSLPKEVLEASSRPSKTSSFQLGLPGSFKNDFWTPFGPLGAGFWTSPGHRFRSQIHSQAALTSFSHKTQLAQTYSCTMPSF